MNSRERVLEAINHQEPDRVPKDLGATNVTGINSVAYQGLLDLLGITEEVEIIDAVQGLARVSSRVKKELGIDTYGIWPRGSAKAVRERGKNQSGAEYFVDEWGFYWQKPPGGYYFDVSKSPLENIQPESFDFRSYPWPEKNDLERLKGVRDEAQRARKETELAIVLGETLDFFLFCCWLRGFQNFLSDLYVHPNFARRLLDKVNEIQMARVENMLREVGDLLDVIGVIGDDWGMQDRTYVSMQMFDQFFKAGIEEMVKMIRKHSAAPVFAHSCGAVKEMLPAFIEIGFNVLNPVQVSAQGMSDTAELKRRFGRDLVFWGGGIDTQQILNRGSLEEVEIEIRRRIGDLAPGGGFIFSAVHNIQPDVPPENILHAFKLVDKWGKYPIKV
jgi:uroporphyrinogen decarboxylase